MSDDRAGVPPFSRLLFSADVFPPLSATIRVEFGARSRCAPSHETNHDHYLVIRLGRTQETMMTSLPDGVVPQRFDEYTFGMVVADGMGQHGEVASRLAVATLLHLALHFGKWQLRVDEALAQDIMERINRFYRQIDHALVQESRSSAETPLHTTMTAAVSAGRDLLFAHVGHSRIYLLRDRDLMQLTRDHTHAIVRDKARVHLLDLTDVASDLHHILTDALGAGTVDPHVDLERLTLADGDVLLLCTNGLTDAVADQEIGTILGSGRPVDDLCEALVVRAAARTEDDVTVVVARYHVPV